VDLAAIGGDGLLPGPQRAKQEEELSWSLGRAQRHRVFTTAKSGSGTPGAAQPRAPPASVAPAPRVPAGGARARLKGTAGGGRPQWRARRPVRCAARSDLPGVGARLAPRRGRTSDASRRGPDGGASRSPDSGQRPPDSRPCSTPVHPGLPMAPEAGAPRSAPRPLPWAALLLLAALIPVASLAGTPGKLRVQAWPSGSRILCPLFCHSGDRRPAWCWLRVVSLTVRPCRLGQGALGLGTGRSARGDAVDPGRLRSFALGLRMHRMGTLECLPAPGGDSGKVKEMKEKRLSELWRGRGARCSPPFF
jgi:hypothetical protein